MENQRLPKSYARWTPLVVLGTVIAMGFFAWVLISNFNPSGSAYKLVLGVAGVAATVGFVVYWFREVGRR